MSASSGPVSLPVVPKLWDWKNGIKWWHLCQSPVSCLLPQAMGSRLYHICSISSPLRLLPVSFFQFSCAWFYLSWFSSFLRAILHFLLVLLFSLSLCRFFFLIFFPFRHFFTVVTHSPWGSQPQSSFPYSYFFFVLLFSLTPPHMHVGVTNLLHLHVLPIFFLPREGFLSTLLPSVVPFSEKVLMNGRSLLACIAFLTLKFKL